MSKIKKEMTSLRAPGLFDAGSFDVSGPFRDVLTKVVKSLNMTPDQAAALISHLSGKQITSEFFKQCKAPSKTDYKYPAEAVAALCAIAGSLEPARVLLMPLGAAVIGPEDSKELKLFRLHQDKERIEAEIEKLRREL